MTVSAPSIFRVTCRYKNTVSGDVVNVYHIKLGTGTAVDEADFVADVEAWINAWNDNMYAAQAAAMDPYELRIDEVEMVGGHEQVVRNIVSKGWTLTHVPDSAGDALPQTDAAIVNLRTAIPRVFGRKYIAGLCETHQAAGQIVSGIVGSLGAYAADVAATFVGTYVTFQAGVLTVKAEEALGFFAPFVGYVVNAIMGTQRRRRINRGS